MYVTVTTVIFSPPPPWSQSSFCATQMRQETVDCASETRQAEENHSEAFIPLFHLKERAPFWFKERNLNLSTRLNRCLLCFCFFIHHSSCKLSYCEKFAHAQAKKYLQKQKKCSQVIAASLYQSTEKIINHIINNESNCWSPT